MHRIAILSAIVLTACTGTDDTLTDKVPSGDTAPVTGCATPFDGPVLISGAAVTCIDDNNVLFQVSTAGLTSGGLVFSQETANATPNYSDEHSVVSVDWDADCGTYDELERQIPTGAASSVPDVETLFRCDTDGSGNPYHHNAVVMTYAFRVYTVEGAFADCVVAGDNPDAVIDNTIDRVTDPVDPAEMASCVEGTLTY